MRSYNQHHYLPYKYDIRIYCDVVFLLMFKRRHISKVCKTLIENVIRKIGKRFHRGMYCYTRLIWFNYNLPCTASSMIPIITSINISTKTIPKHIWIGYVDENIFSFEVIRKIMLGVLLNWMDYMLSLIYILASSTILISKTLLQNLGFCLSAN